MVLEKAVAREAYREGYKLGYGVEDLDSLDEKVAKNRFERWWENNWKDTQ